MSGKIELSLELAENLLHCGRTNSCITPAMTEELRALLAAPVVEGQEPVYLLRYLPGSAGWRDADKAAFDSVQAAPNYERRVLYTSPPAPVAVVLPERKPIPDQATFNGGNAYYAKCFDEARSWNACIDECRAAIQAAGVKVAS